MIDDQLDGWGFLTRRNTELAVYDDQILPHSPFSGWVAFAIGPDDIDAAVAGLDEHWPAKFDLARRHWGQPAYVGIDAIPASSTRNTPSCAQSWTNSAATTPSSPKPSNAYNTSPTSTRPSAAPSCTP